MVVKVLRQNLLGKDKATKQKSERSINISFLALAVITN